MKIRIIDLSGYVQRGGDIGDYFDLHGKNRPSFTNEILWKARIARPFSDVPDFIRQQVHSDKFRRLKPLDRLLYFELTVRVARHFVRTGPINGMRVQIRPGQYFSSVAKLVEICECYSNKQTRNAIARLIKTGFIKRKNLNHNRGSIFSLVGWADENGQTEWRMESWAQDLVDFPPPPIERVANES